jgi:hypothetical protein
LPKISSILQHLFSGKYWQHLEPMADEDLLFVQTFLCLHKPVIRCLEDISQVGDICMSIVIYLANWCVVGREPVLLILAVLCCKGDGVLVWGHHHDHISTTARLYHGLYSVYTVKVGGIGLCNCSGVIFKCAEDTKESPFLPLRFLC